MRSRRVIPPVLLVLALFSAAAGAQDAELAQAVATPPKTDVVADEFNREDAAHRKIEARPAN